MSDNNEKTVEFRRVSDGNTAPSADNSKKKQSKGPMKKKKRKEPVAGKLKAQRITAWVLIVLTSLGVLGVATVGIYAGIQINKTTPLAHEDFIPTSSSTFYASNDQSFFETGYKLRDNIGYDDLSNSVIDAFIAIEDSRFFTHNGFDVPRFTRAALNNLKKTVTSGKLDFSEGGSTFTMQLIKQTEFMSDGSDGEDVKGPDVGSSGISRKIQEIYLSQKIDGGGVLSKKLILELYLNQIDFGVGNNTVGIENSSKAYFGKSASELNTVEAAMMAGVINAPYAYSPYMNIQKANERTQQVLDLMLQHGYISDEEHAIASAVRVEDLLVERKAQQGNAHPYQSYADAVVEEVIELTGKDPGKVPMKVYTALDLDVQAGLDRVQAREIDELTFDEDSGIQVGSAVVNNKTGEIVGTVGGYDYNGQRITNRATNTKYARVRPASTLKPVVSYAPAYNYLGWSTDHIITDDPYDTGGGFVVTNYDNRYEGEITLDRAISDSRNVPAVKTFMTVADKIGYDAYRQYFTNIGLTIDETNNGFGWGVAMGNDPLYATPAEMAAANAMLYNDGKYIKPHTVVRIEFEDGSAPYVPEYTPTQVIQPGAAYMATRNMKYVIDSGSTDYTNVTRRNYPVYGKTGTNQYDPIMADELGYPKAAQESRLMMTATGDFSISTWVGFPSADRGQISQPYFSPSEQERNVPGKLNSYILSLLEDSFGVPTDVSMPSDVTQITHIKGPFPYQSPLPDMNKDLISTGYILKDFAKLAEAKPQDLSPLSDATFTATSIGQQFTFNIDMTAYPDASKLKEADASLVMPHPHGGSVTGKRVFDESWIYGAVRYKTEIRADGNPIAEQMSESNTFTVAASVPPETKQLEVCSYYTFEKATSRKSNQICKPVDASQIPSEAFPNFVGQSYGIMRGWAEPKGVTLQPNFVVRNDMAYGEVISVSPNVAGKQYTSKELAALTLKVDVSDNQFESGITVETLLNDPNSQYLNIVNASGQDKKRIIGYTVNGTTTQSIRTSVVGKNPVTLVLE